MTTTAIALFGSRISPRFDCAQDFMVITCSKNTVTDQYIESILDPVPLKKIRRLANLKVNILICGGVDEASREQLKAHDIKLIADKKGNADEAVSCHLPPAHTNNTPAAEILARHQA
ncbi:MAG: NifB/NifX family molybdenum-iron cluster-binding protein [Desulfobulbaceae bacterium]|nr:NifB/NifX family molybdenum-iron cluster-binding protein [Desulfobulbaceae bacterium]